LRFDPESLSCVLPDESSLIEETPHALTKAAAKEPAQKYLNLARPAKGTAPEPKKAPPAGSDLLVPKKAGPWRPSPEPRPKGGFEPGKTPDPFSPYAPGRPAADAVKQVEDALKAVRDARDPEAQRRAAEALDQAVQQLRGQLKSAGQQPKE